MEAISDLDGCWYVSVYGYTWAWTHILPTLMTLSLTVASLRLHGYEWFGGGYLFLFFFFFFTDSPNFSPPPFHHRFPTIYGVYLHFWQLILWAFQVNWQIMRPHPSCAHIHTYAFPSQEAFYVAALSTLIILYSYLWRIPMAILTWLFIYTLIMGVPAVLVFFQYNRPWEILISMILGIVATVPFVLVIRLYIRPYIPYILNQFPWYHFEYVDTFCCTKQEQKFKNYITACLARCKAARIRTNIVVPVRGLPKRGLHYSHLL